MNKVNALLMATILAGLALTANASITTVDILPATPAPTDLITVVTHGIEGYGGVSITGSAVNKQDTTIELDIHLSLGPLTILTPWSHSKEIGQFQPGTYDLTVRTYENLQLLNTYNASFNVVPEPLTLMLLPFGCAFIRRR